MRARPSSLTEAAGLLHRIEETLMARLMELNGVVAAIKSSALDPDSSGDALTLLGGAQLSLIEALSRLRALRMELAIGSTSNAEGAS